MKKFLFFILVATATILASCTKEEVEIERKDLIADYSSVTSQNRITVAKSLIEAFNDNPELAKITIQECNKMFDGDRNVLLKDLIKVNVSELKSSNSIFGNVLNDYLTNQTSLNLKSSTKEDIISKIINNDPFVQIYYFAGNENSKEIDGIVILPEKYDDMKDKSLKLISIDGKEKTILSDVEPKENYMVVSTNERINTKGNINFKSLINLENELDAPIGIPMRITNASFTSLAAKRAVEPWTGGEPEVFLYIIYALKDNLNNKWDSKCAQFEYTNPWLEVNSYYYTTGVKWVDQALDCPYWYLNEHSFDKNLRWVEADGSTCELNYTVQVTTNQETGDKTTLNFKIPSSTGEDVIASSFIDYYNPGNGEQNWGSIKFILEF